MDDTHRFDRHFAPIEIPPDVGAALAAGFMGGERFALVFVS